MADEYTPTTWEVRAVFTGHKSPHDEEAERFDAWLAAHDREVAAKALREFAKIANLIALAAGRSDSFEEALPILYDEAAAALVEFVQSGGSQVSGPDEFPEIRAEIRKGLGM